MKTPIKIKRTRIFFSFLFFCCINTILGQNIRYTYDAAGNRVKREIVLAFNSPKKVADTNYEELISDKNVKIYPNSEEGTIRVEIDGLTENDEYSIQVFDISGRVVTSPISSDQPIIIDISSAPMGVYILAININGELSSWKITKQ